MGVQSARNAFVDTVEGTSANEEDVRRIDLYEFLVGVFASSLRRNVHDRAFEYLQQCLLYPFAGYVARDGWVVAFTGYLVYLVDEDDAPFGLRYVVVGSLEQTCKDAFHIFAHISRFGEHRGVHYREGNVEHPGDGTCQQRLARSRLPYHDDVGFVYLHFILFPRFGLGVHEPFIMVVNRYCERLFRIVLSDYVLVEELLYLGRLHEVFPLQFGLFAEELFLGHLSVHQGFVSPFYALVAYCGTVCTGEQHPYLRYRQAAERTLVRFDVCPFVICHCRVFSCW